MSTTTEKITYEIEAETILTLRGQWLSNLPVGVPVIVDGAALGMPPNVDGSRGHLYVGGLKVGRVLAVGYNAAERRHTVRYEPS